MVWILLVITFSGPQQARNPTVTMQEFRTEADCKMIKDRIDTVVYDLAGTLKAVTECKSVAGK